MRLALKKPVQNGSETVSELTLREDVIAGDLRGIKMSALADPSTDDLLKIAGRLCAQPDTVMSKLCPADMLAVMEATGGFLSAGLEIGKTQSH